MADLPTPDDVRRYGALLHKAAHGANEGVGRYPQMCSQFDRYAEVLLTALTQDGRLLPPGAETRVEYGSRVLLDGEVTNEGPAAQQLARTRVDYHDARRQQEPGWRGSAVVLRRTHHTTPWTEHAEP